MNIIDQTAVDSAKEPVSITDNSQSQTTDNVLTQDSKKEVVENIVQSQPAQIIQDKNDQGLNNIKKSSNLLEKEAKIDESNQKYWQDDWKEKMASGDEKLLKILDKYKNPTEAMKAYKELQSQFSKTRPLPELPENPTPEQLTEYRQQVGIPDSWDKYSTELKDVTIGDFDKPVVEEFLKKAHSHNMSQKEITNTLQAYFEVQEELTSNQIKASEAQTAQVQQSLQKEWGSEYKNNINKIKSFIDTEMGSEFANKLNSAVLPDGTFLLNDTKLLNHFLGQAQAKGMGGSISPTDEANYVSLTDRKVQLEKLRNLDRKSWYNQRDLRQELEEITVLLKQKK